MISVTTCKTIEEAEEVGRQLLEQGIEVPRIEGGEVFVNQGDEERAWEILGFQKETPPELLKPAPFHPCPKCGAANPVWYGKRKGLLLLALFAINVMLVLQHSHAIVFVAPASVVIFAIAIKTIPEWECRQCRHQWLKEPLDS